MEAQTMEQQNSRTVPIPALLVTAAQPRKPKLPEQCAVS